jgi:ribonucleoside-diphosphate reductase alpha chain
MTRGRVKDKNLMLVSSSDLNLPNPVKAMQTTAVTALKQDRQEAPQVDLPPLEEIKAAATKDTATLRIEAQMKGYVGEACSECQNFTLVRNGTCLKCDTCGSTTGCS